MKNLTFLAGLLSESLFCLKKSFKNKLLLVYGDLSRKYNLFDPDSH